MSYYLLVPRDPLEGEETTLEGLKLPLPVALREEVLCTDTSKPYHWDEGVRGIPPTYPLVEREQQRFQQPSISRYLIKQRQIAFAQYRLERWTT